VDLHVEGLSRIASVTSLLINAVQWYTNY